MLINNETSSYIRANATASIGTEGLMGNKVINIVPGGSGASHIESGGMLKASSNNGLDDMLHTLSKTNANALEISLRLKEVADRLSSSIFLEQLLSDTSIHIDLKRTMHNFRNSSLDIKNAATSLQYMVEDVRGGKGAAGTYSLTTMRREIFPKHSAASGVLLVKLKIWWVDWIAWQRIKYRFEAG